MTDTVRTTSYLLTQEFRDGQAAGSITPQYIRDFVVSSRNVAPARNTVTADYTLALSDLGGVVEANSSSALTVTVPPNSSVAFPVGSVVDIYAMGTGQVTIAAGAGVTIRTPLQLSLRSQFSTVRLEQRAANEWVASRDLQPFAPVLPQRIANFTNSLGMNIHVQNYITPDIDLATIVSHLQYLGVKIIRDGLATDAYQITEWATIAAAGIKLCMNPLAASTTLVVADNVTAAASIAQTVTNALAFVEQPNEPSNNLYTYNGSTVTFPGASPGFLPAAQFMSAYYTALKQNSFLSPIPVLAVSQGGAEPDDSGVQFNAIPVGYSHNTLTTNASTASANATLHFASVPTTGASGIVAGLYIYGTGVPANATVSSTTSTTVVMSAAASATIASGTSIRFGARMPDQTIFGDVINLHCYPMAGGTGASAQSVDPVIGDQFQLGLASDHVTTYQAGYSGYTLAQVNALPKLVSEYGYETTGAVAGGTALDQATAGKNNLTAWCNAWWGGFSYFIIYGLYDDSSTGPYFGQYSFAEGIKLGGTYLHNFTTILADTAFNANVFSPSNIAFGVTNLPSTGRYMLFQRADGTFFVVMWNNVNNWTISTGTPLTVSATSVTVTFEISGTISTYDPTISATAQTTAYGSVVTLSLTDHPLIISIK